MLDKTLKNITKTTLYVIILVLGSLFCWSVLAGEWELVEDKKEVKVFLREIDGSEIREFKGITKVKTSLGSLVGVLDDTEACPKWFHQCESPLIIQQLDFKDRYAYQISDFPFPAGDRDVLTRMTFSQDPASKAITITLQAVPHYCKDKTLHACKKINNSTLVRIVKSVGYLRFQPLDDGWVEVTWQHHIEPAGKLPSWLINTLVVDFPMNSLTNLKRLVENSKYQKVTLDYGANGEITGLQGVSW